MAIQSFRIKFAVFVFSFLFSGLQVFSQSTQCVPDDLTIECDDLGNQVAMDSWNTSNESKLQACTDNLGCDTVVVSSDYDFSNFETACGSAGSITVEYTVTTCVGAVKLFASVSVDDTTIPILTCDPDNIVIECSDSENIMTEVIAWNEANIALLQGCSTDECNPQVLVSSNFISSDFSCDSDVTVAYTVTDDCGNFVEVNAICEFTNTGGDDTGGDDTGGDDTGGDDTGGDDTGGDDTSGDDTDGDDTGGDDTGGDDTGGDDTGGDDTGGDDTGGDDTGGDDTGGDDTGGDDTGGDDTGGDDTGGDDTGGDDTSGDDTDGDDTDGDDTGGDDTGGDDTGGDDTDGDDTGGDDTGGDDTSGDDTDGDDTDGDDTGGDDTDGCSAVGGVFITIETDTTEVKVCVGDDRSDAVYAKVWEAEGDSFIYVVTDADGNILRLTDGFIFQFEGTGVGINYIYHLSSVGDVAGLSEGSNISDLSGCYELSNSIKVNKVNDGEDCGCAMMVLLGDATAICEGETITIEADVLNSNVCEILCADENDGTLVEWDMDACHSITNGVDNMDFSELAPIYPNEDECVNIEATHVNVEGGMHSCTVPKDGLGGRAMCFSGSKKCYWKDDSPDALKFSVTLTPENSSTITGLQFYESAPERFTWYNPDFSEDIDEGPNNYPRFYGLRVTKNGKEIFQQNDIETTNNWTLEEFDFSDNPEFKVRENTTFVFELLAYCPAWRNAITYAWDLDNIKLLGGCCDQNSTITAVDYQWSTGETSQSITVTPAEDTEYTVTVTDCTGCTATKTLPIEVKKTLTANIGEDITICREDLPVVLTNATSEIAYNEWSTGEEGESIMVSEAGTYSVTVTDGVACSDSDELIVSIIDPDPIDLPDNIDPLCADGTIDLSTLEPSGQAGGVWTSANGEVVSNVSAGDYTYTYVDDNGCEVSDQVSITEDNFSFTIDDQGPICPDDTFDFSSIVPDGVDGDSWEVEDLGDGNYRLTGTNANGCIASDEFSVSVDNFTITLMEPPVLCEGEVYMLMDQVPADYAGGTWTDGDGNVVDKATPGMFTYTVTNDNGCTASDKITFTSSGFILMQLPDDSVCWGETILLSTLEFPEQSGGIWKDLNNNVVTHGEQDAFYRYHLFDEVNECAQIVTIKIHEKYCEDLCAGYTVPVAETPEVCPGDSIMLTTLEVDGFTGGTWKDLNNNVVTRGTIGTYTYNYFEDVNECVAVVEVDIHHQHDGCTDVCAGVSVSVNSPDAICSDESINLSSLETDGSTGGTWTNGDGGTVTEVGVGTYTYTFTDGNGCTATAQVEVSAKDCTDPCAAFNISFTNPAPICDDATFDLATLVSSAAVGGEWTNADGTAVTTVGPGVYTYTVTTNEGCSATADVTIVGEDCGNPCDNFEAVIDLGDDVFICQDEFPISIDLEDLSCAVSITTVDDGSAFIDANGIITFLEFGTFPVAVTDANGQTAVDTLIISEATDCIEPCDQITQFEMANGIIELCEDELPLVFLYDLTCFESLAVGGPDDAWAFLDDTSGGPGLELTSFDAEVLIEVVTQNLDTVLFNITIKEKDCNDPCDDHIPSIDLGEDITLCSEDAPFVYIPNLTCQETISYSSGNAGNISFNGDTLFVSGSAVVDVVVTGPNGERAEDNILVIIENCVTNPCEDFVATKPNLGEDREVCESEFPIVIALDMNDCIKGVSLGRVGDAEILDNDRTIQINGPGDFTVALIDVNDNTTARDSLSITLKDCTDPVTPCDDGNPNTENDVVIDDCNCCGTPISGQVIYVDADAVGVADGTSWTDALTDLQEAMMGAESGQEIWVADGTYLPTQDGDQDAYFNMPSGVDLYGGFSGTELNICQRDFTSTRTILSGDLAGDDKAHSTNLLPLELLFEGTEENSHNVLRNSRVTDDIKIDGVAITGGVADGSETAGGGAFLFVTESDATIEFNNVLIVQNQGAGLGGGGRLSTRANTTMNVKMNRVIFLQNRTQGPALSKGGALFMGGWDDGFIDAEITSCIFAQNYAQDRGGAVNNDDNVKAIYTNSLFTGNKAANGGAVFENNGDNEAIHTNNTFYLNHADANGGAIVNFRDFGSNTVESKNCIYFGNVSLANAGPALYNFDNSSNPFSIQNCMFNETLAMLEAGADINDIGGNQFAVSDPLFTDPLQADFSLQSGSPAINAGENNLVTLSEDLAGNTRIQEDVVDLGALESGENGECFTDIFEIANASLVQPEYQVYEEYFQEEAIETYEAVEVITYPNPTTDYVNVAVTKINAEDEVSLQLFDIAGNSLPADHRMINDFGNKVEYSVPVKDFKGGVYLLKTTVGRFTINKRVIVIK